MNEKQRQAAEAASLSRTGTAILRSEKTLEVRWLPNGEELGFTSEKPFAVNVAWEHAIFNGLSDDEKTIMRMGVFAHELLHQCLTNFDYTNKVCEELSQAKASILMIFANTLEDPAIEYFAPNIFGGNLLDALRFSIRHIYVNSPGIGDEKHAFAQLINALIQFGDMGIIKGKFSFPEAEEYFQKVAPLYNEGIECPDSRRRIDIAKECMQICQPLWESLIKDQEEMDNLINQLQKNLRKKGSPKIELTEMREKSSSSDKRAKMVGKIMRGMKEGDAIDPGNDSKGNDIGTSENSSNAAGLQGVPDEELEIMEESQSQMESHFSPSENASSNSAGSNSLAQNESDDKRGVQEAASLDDLCMDADLANKIVNEEFEVNAEVVEKIKCELEANDLKEANMRKAERTPASIPDFNITSNIFKSASCLNRQVVVSTANAGELYKDMISQYSWDIKCLTKALNKIFESKHDEAYRATSGSYNIKRGSTGISARIFDRRREKGNLKDAAVMLCIDQSGSMTGESIVAARKAAIVFTESLAALKIPCYIMGFTADRGADAVHNHFVTWESKPSQRAAIVGMTAAGNNFDGYSIRYAAELLKSRNETNKIMFVVSDGQPSCRKYSEQNGIVDTASAIKESRRFGTVFGIALGYYCEPELLQGMYGRDFIHCEDVNLLTQILCGKLRDIIRNGS